MDINVIIEESFEKWLKTLGYAGSTVYLSTHYVRDFFFYLKTLKITELEAVNIKTLEGYYKYLQKRGNRRRTGGLSDNYMNSNFNALRRFSRYLQETGKPFFEVTVKTRPDKENPKIILTGEEIKALYKACGSDYLGVRDRAMLSIYYGCGLRRSEGTSLDVKDVLFKERLVFVRSGKGNRERYVPMTGVVTEDLEAYILQGREHIRSFKGGLNPEALFLSMRGKRLCGNQVISRLQKLAQAAGINKPVGLHTLRHSIATHLLQSGLTLEEVGRFLGHISLESTQIYTHLANE
ncbi:MAG: tyrosine-type recombinase/integrase [Bacteroidales bacterium]|nr:tyrosine-type recombinase/integrase [Bacteroidales bacterium]